VAKMKKVTVFLLFMILFSSACSFAEETDLKPQSICPVMGGEIDKTVYVDFQGQRIYFCCPSCKETFLENPEKYMKKFADDRVLLESVQEFCPVMVGHNLPCFINKNVYTDYNGRRIYFCTTDCKKSFLKEPEKYLKYLSDESLQE
jgi:YHS domain-containing protein